MASEGACSSATAELRCPGLDRTSKLDWHTFGSDGGAVRICSRANKKRPDCRASWASPPFGMLDALKNALVDPGYSA